MMNFTTFASVQRCNWPIFRLIQVVRHDDARSFFALVTGLCLVGLAEPRLTAMASGLTAGANTPVFAPAGGVFTGSIVIRLVTTNLLTRYTLDGSEPTTNSAPFTNSITLTSCATLRALAFPTTGVAGPIVSHTFAVLDDDLKDFTSNLPLVLIDSGGTAFTDDNKVTSALRVIPADPGTTRTSLAGQADYAGRAVLGIRGRSSRRAPKHSFSVKLIDDAADTKQKVSLLGLPRESDWVLYAPWADKSLLRDVLSYELGNEMGRYAPRTRLVELFLVTQGTRVRRADYFGVYVLVERITRDKFRLNLDKIERDDSAEPDITGGYIFKKDHYGRDRIMRPRRQMEELESDGGLATGFGVLFQSGGFPVDPASITTPDGIVVAHKNVPAITNRSSGLSFREEDSAGRPRLKEGAVLSDAESCTTRFAGNHFFFVHPEPDEITGAQRAWLGGYLDRLERVLYGPDFRNPLVGYAAYVDAGSFIDYHLLTEVTKNVDGFRFSTYYHKDRNGLLRMGPLWDMNLTFGNASGKEGWLPERWLWPQLNDQEYSWFRRLFEDPDFGQKYVDRWSELRTNVFATARLLARVDALAAQLHEAQQRNFARWPILGERVVPNRFVGDSYAQEIAFLKDWAEKRLAWINRQFLPVPSATIVTTTNGSTPVATLAIAGPQTPGQIFFTLDGSDPRAAGGGLRPTARACEAPLSCAPGQQLFARFKRENRWSGPLVLVVP